MKEDQFIQINSSTWRELEDFSLLLGKKGVKKLPSEKIKRFLYVFRQSSHHLAYARTHYPNSKVADYLNSIVGKAHSHVYVVKKTTPYDVLKYVFYGFPKLLKEHRFYIIASFSFFMIGFLISLLMVLQNQGTASFFLPPEMVEGTKGSIGGGQWNSPLMSSYIMVNNITVSLKAFIYGITLGLGTIYVLFFNGQLLGALTGVVYLHNDPRLFWSLILPHGVIELAAIFISGAAGLIIARSFLIPGELTRKHSLIKGTKKAMSLMLGVVFMLVIAGIIEGFFTPLEISPDLKLLFAGVTAVLLGIYVSIPYVVKK